MQEIDDIALDLFRLSQRVERLNRRIHGDAWLRKQEKDEKERRAYALAAAAVKADDKGVNF